MQRYKNLMETLVEEKYDELDLSVEYCRCEQCRNDVIAYALNQLPAKYVVTHQGEMYSKLQFLSTQYKMDIVSAIVHGSEIVGRHPSHSALAEEEKP